MRIKLFFTICCLCFSSLIWSQAAKSFVGKILDEKQQGIPYVNIGIVNESIGTVSKEDGSFELFLRPDLADSLRLRFSAIGYKNQTFTLGAFRKSPISELVLATDFLTFDVITVKPGGFISDWEGKIKLSTKLSVNFSIPSASRQNLGAEIGRRFKFKNKAYQIQSLRFYINQNNFSSTKFRVNIYAEKRGEPGQLLQQEDIIFHLKDQTTGWQTIELEKYELKFQQSIIVALQWIDYSDDGKILSMPLQYPRINGQHYYKFGSQANWKHYPNMASSLQIKVAE